MKADVSFFTTLSKYLLITLLASTYKNDGG